MCFCLLLHQEYAKDEETLKAVYQSVNAVVGILRSFNEDLPPRPGTFVHFMLISNCVQTMMNASGEFYASGTLILHRLFVQFSPVFLSDAL